MRETWACEKSQYTATQSRQLISDGVDIQYSIQEYSRSPGAPELRMMVTMSFIRLFLSEDDRMEEMAELAFVVISERVRIL